VYSQNKVLVFNLGFDAKGPAGIHWIYYPQRELCFYRVGFYDNIFDTPRMSLYVEVGYPAAEPLDEAAIGRTRDRVLADLTRAGVVTTQRLIAEHHVVLDPAYVHITKASLADVAAKRALLEARGVYTAGRYGSWTYCSIEDNIVEARALATRFNTLHAAGAL
jgi:protoporphyrinogen oxidase